MGRHLAECALAAAAHTDGAASERGLRGDAGNRRDEGAAAGLAEEEADEAAPWRQQVCVSCALSMLREGSRLPFYVGAFYSAVLRVAL